MGAKDGLGLLELLESYGKTSPLENPAKEVVIPENTRRAVTVRGLSDIPAATDLSNLSAALWPIAVKERVAQELGVDVADLDRVLMRN